MNQLIKVTTEVWVDVNNAHSILDKFSSAGLGCKITFEFPEESKPVLKTDYEDLQKPMNQIINQPVPPPTEVAQVVTNEQNAPAIELDEAGKLNKDKAMGMGLKMGSLCHIPSVTNSQGVLVFISPDYSMFLLKMSDNSTVGTPANSHDATVFPLVKIGDKIKWAELDDIAVGMKA